MKEEDEEHTLIFVDMLGFKALTKKYRTRVIDERDEERGFITSYTSGIQNDINKFYRIVNHRVFKNSSGGYPRITAMLFSDCAFLDAGNSIAAAFLAKEIMRDLISNRLPARMGIGRGTFYVLGFSTDLGDSVISQCRFAGTAVVHAYEAECSGPKGMRILLHPSAVSDLQEIRSSQVNLLSLPKAFHDAAYELDYLYDATPLGATPSADQQDKELISAVLEMKDPEMPFRVRRQYVETLKALNRMRKVRSRRPVVTRPKQN